MIPILYSTLTEGTVPSHNGLGCLTDCLSCKVTEERNGSYELTLSYAAAGIHASDILVNRFIKAKPNFTDNPQLFRIYHVGKTMNGSFSVKAQHISYDLSGKLISSGTAASCTAACSVLTAKAGSFTINTDKSVSAAFKITAPSSVRSWFGGKAGSLLDVYGGEWKFDNYTASLKNSRGANRGVQIRYGKNLTELSQEIDIQNLCTGVLPYYIDQDGNVTEGTKVNTGLTLDVPKDLAVDFSQEVNPDSGTAITSQLATLAQRYIANNVLTTAINSITLDFVQLSSLQDRVDLCDTVSIYFDALGISANLKCVATTWNVLQERYESTTFGASRTNIADTFVAVQKETSQAASRSYLAEAVNHATALITGNLGGYVILHDSDNNGQPDEILIMDTADISTATKVWRWNKNGLGYSSNGYSGPYGLAMTSNGEIVADFITTGILNANLIKAGVIQDVNNKFAIDLLNGTTVLNQMMSKSSLKLVTDALEQRILMSYTVNDGTTVRLYDPNNTAIASIEGLPSGYGGVFVGDNNGNTLGSLQGSTSGAILFIKAKSSGSTYFYVKDSNDNTVAQLGETEGGGAVLALGDGTNNLVYLHTQSDGGAIRVYNNSGDMVGIFYANPAHGGTLALRNSSGTYTITGSGDSGNITCVSLTQTSSRKVKKNVKAMTDFMKILELDAVSFDYKNEAQGKDKRGFIAEDVAKVLPNLVTEATEEIPATLDYMQMIPYLQAVIKAQDKRIKALEDKLGTED